MGDKVLIDNALLEFEVIDKKEDYVLLKALGDGKILNHKTINVPGVDLKLDFISDVDKEDISFAAGHSCDYLALSFVNSGEDAKLDSVISASGLDNSSIDTLRIRVDVTPVDDIPVVAPTLTSKSK